MIVARKIFSRFLDGGEGSYPHLLRLCCVSCWLFEYVANHWPITLFRGYLISLCLHEGVHKIRLKSLNNNPPLLRAVVPVAAPMVRGCCGSESVHKWIRTLRL